MGVVWIDVDTVIGLLLFSKAEVNVLMHTYVDPENDSIEELRRAHGAVWDVFRRQDVNKLEEYLKMHSGEFKHKSPLQQVIHPIHERAFYLSEKHIRNLKKEYGIEPWNFTQRLGDAIFIPAGCPHQIRNVKSCISVAVNFVSPESVGECIRLSDEYRTLPLNHPFKEDKLQVKKITFHAIRQAVEYLYSVSPIITTSTSTIIPPCEDFSPDNPPSYAYMRETLESMLSRMEQQQDHLCRYPGDRAQLRNDMSILLNKIIRAMEEEKSSS